MVAKKAGQFAGGFFNNPGVVAIVGGLGAVAITLLFFQNDVRNFFANLKFPDITLPTINLPDITFPSFDFDFPTIELPTIEFPSFDFLAAFAPPPPGSAVDGEITPGDIDVPGGVVTIPPGQTVDPETGIVTGPPPTIVSTGDDLSTFFGEQRPLVFDTLIRAFGLTPVQAEIELRGAETIEDLDTILQRLNQEAIALERGDELPGAVVIPSDIAIAEPLPIIETEISGEFFGGGPSFIGGDILPTLSELIRTGQAETASEAADILAQLKGFTPEEEAFLTPKIITPEGTIFDFVGGGPPAVSSPEFEGLTPEEIFAQLVGGNISNF